MAVEVQVDAFTFSLNGFRFKTEKQAKLAQAKITLQLQKGFILANPVDTGTMRGGWVASVGQPSEYVPETLDDRSPEGSTGAAGAANMEAAKSILSQLMAAPLGTPTFVVDNVRYSAFVNRSHPNKAGFVQAVIANVETQFAVGGKE